MTEKVALYCRVSSDPGEKHTVDDQLHECHLYAERNNLEIVEEFVDEGVSGTLAFDERPSGRRLLEAAEAKSISRTLTYCVDRLARDIGEGVDAYRKLAKLGAPVEFVLQSIDGSPEGQLSFGLFLSFASYELASIRRRTMQGRQRRIREGAYIASHVPFGYDKTDDGGLIVNEAEAATVRRIFHMAAEGHGLHSIANTLIAEGVTVSHKESKYNTIHSTTIGKILSARRFIGQGTYGGQPMQSPRVIDDDLWAAVRTALARRQIEALRNTRNVYLLQNRLFCGHCGSLYLSLTANGKKVHACRERTIYGEQADHSGVKFRWKAEELEEPVKDLIARFISKPKAAVKLLEAYTTDLDERAKEVEDKRAPLRSRIDDLTRQEENVLALARRGVYSGEDQLVQQLEVIRSERADVLHALKQLEVSTTLADPKTVLEALREFWTEVSEAVQELDQRAAKKGVDVSLVWEDWSEAQWKLVVSRLIDRIDVQDDGSLLVTGALAGGQQLVVSPSTRSRVMRYHYVVTLSATQGCSRYAVAPWTAGAGRRQMEFDFPWGHQSARF